jgi:hypothetical protein
MMNGSLTVREFRPSQIWVIANARIADIQVPENWKETSIRAPMNDTDATAEAINKLLTQDDEPNVPLVKAYPQEHVGKHRRGRSHGNAHAHAH